MPMQDRELANQTQEQRNSQSLFSKYFLSIPSAANQFHTSNEWCERKT